MANTSNQILDNLSFQAFMNQVGRGDRAAQQALYRFFPETASQASGRALGAKGLMSKGALRTGAMGVAKMGSRRLPVLAGVMQAAGGDLAGGVGTAGGGIAGGIVGGMVGGPVGALAGSWLGSSLGSSAAQGITGFDPNNPLAGPDWNLGPIALTPYARTKKDLKKQIKLAEMQLPLYNQIADKNLERQLVSQTLATTGQLLANNPYIPRGW
jgi:hypothetical protein